MKIFFSFMLLFNIILSNTNTIQSIEITTSDGNIFVGTLIEEDENLYRIVTNSGINIDIPKSIVKEVNYIELFSGEEGLYRPDPNKSMYLFAPSAYPIGDGNSYIRDFQVFFPSYNRGFKENISIQAGALIFPIPLEYVPAILSAKYSFPKKNNIQFSTGALYMTAPLNFESSWATGITFANATIGDLFRHYSICLGWGYSRDDRDVEFWEDPIIVFAGNERLSDRTALVFEFWKFPDVGIEYSPLLISTRFIGRKFSVDIGAAIFLELLDEGIPIPILNFTYHP